MVVPLITIIMVLPDRFTSLTWAKSTCRLSGNEEFYKSMSVDYVTLPDILHELCQTKDVFYFTKSKVPTSSPKDFPFSIYLS